MNNEHTCPRMLPIVDVDGRSWFVDERLAEFHDVWNPDRRVALDTDRGLLMLAVYANDEQHMDGDA